jgi:hypothetical protein
MLMYKCSPKVDKITQKTFPYPWIDECNGDIYPQYWEALDVKVTLAILKDKFCHCKPTYACDTLVVSLLNPTMFDQVNKFFYPT